MCPFQWDFAQTNRALSLMNMAEQDMKKVERKIYSLPEFNHWRSCIGVCNVGGIFSIVVNTVLCGDTMMCYYFWRACCMYRWSCGLVMTGNPGRYFLISFLQRKKNNTPY